jgi:AraC-like DNA-binding protein
MPVLSIGLSGTGRRWYRSGGKTLELQSGAPRFDIYGAKYERDYGRWEGECGESICFRLDPAVIERYLHEEACYFDLITVYEHVDNTLRDALVLLADEIQRGIPNGLLYAEGLSLSIFGWLNQHYSEHRQKPQKPQKPRSLSAWQKARISELVEEYLGTNLSVERMASEVGISPPYFSQMFRNAFGVPPHRFVMQRRIERAAYLLRNEPQRTVTDIAFTTGFSSQAHLTCAFKRYKNQPPARWREG